MKLQCVRTATLLLLCAMPAAGQSVSELLQKGIYTQETVGDVDAAARIFQQIIQLAPAGSHVRLQALRRLHDIEEGLRVGRRTPPLGSMVGNVYTHRATGLRFTLPPGWKVLATHPSSEGGEMVSMVAEAPNASINIWLTPEQNDWDSLNRKLDQSPAAKIPERQGTYAGYRWRDGSVRRTMVGPYQAMAAIGDYLDPEESMVEWLTWIYTEKTHTFFFAHVRGEDFEQLRSQLDALIASAVIP